VNLPTRLASGLGNPWAYRPILAGAQITPVRVRETGSAAAHLHGGRAPWNMGFEQVYLSPAVHSIAPFRCARRGDPPTFPRCVPARFLKDPPFFVLAIPYEGMVAHPLLHTREPPVVIDVV